MNESALQSLLTELEASRSSLHSSLRFWEWVVVAGVVLELVIIVKEYWDARRAFRRGTIRSPEKPSTFLLIFGLLGAGMVALGIAKELSVDAKIEGIETQIRGANEQLFGIVSKEAEAAASVSEIAKDNSDEAESHIEGAVRKADELSRKVEAAKNDLAQLQFLVSARHVMADKIEPLKEQLKPLKGKTVMIFASVRDDEEAKTFCNSIASALQSAGMNTMPGCGSIGGIVAPTAGVLVVSSDFSMSELLAKALVAATGSGAVAVPKDPSDPRFTNLTVIVGPKNPFWIGK